MPDSLRGLRVLVAEDELLISEMLGEILHNFECNVVGPVSSLTDALHVIRTSDFDAALLDVQLGNANIYPAAKELKLRNIPFVLMSGYGALTGSPQILREAPKLDKPYDVHQLMNIMTSSFLRRDRGQSNQP